jgi:predicted phage-related endonuclease
MIDPDNLRSQGIGGSEVGAIFGCDERRDAFAVWARKKGHLRRDDSPNMRAEYGKALEQGILRLYTLVTGREVVHHDRTCVHPDRPWQVYTPDALCVHERRGVDAKLVFWDQRHRWGYTADELPERVVLQCFWYMSALDYDVWDVAALIGEEEPRIITVYRDPEAEAAMLARVEEWHARYIAGDDIPPIGNSEESSQWLKETYRHHKRPDMVEASQGQAVMLDRLAEVRSLEAELKAEHKTLDNRIRQAIGSREGIYSATARYTWRLTKDSEFVDWQALGRSLMKGLDDEVAIIQEFTRLKPGYRRTYFKHEAMTAGGDEE